MTLTFRDYRYTQKLVALCKSRRLRGTVKRENGKDVVRIADNQFRNQTERAKFVAAWATMTLEVVDVAPRPRERMPSRSSR